MIRTIKKIMDPLHRRVRLMVFRGTITLVNDALKEQGLQITLMSGETLDDVERYQQYGSTSVPHPGGECIGVSLGGNHNHSIVIATGDRRYRLTGLEQGEVALYSDEGDYVKLKRGRVVEVVTETFLVKAATKVSFETPLVETTGHIQAVGEITDRRDADGRSMESMRSTYDVHTHPENNVNGGSTNAPNQTMG